MVILLKEMDVDERGFQVDEKQAGMQAGTHAGKHLGGIQSEPCPVYTVL